MQNVLEVHLPKSKVSRFTSCKLFSARITPHDQWKHLKISVMCFLFCRETVAETTNDLTLNTTGRGYGQIGSVVREKPPADIYFLALAAPVHQPADILVWPGAGRGRDVGQLLSARLHQSAQNPTESNSRKQRQQHQLVHRVLTPIPVPLQLVHKAELPARARLQKSSTNLTVPIRAKRKAFFCSALILGQNFAAMMDFLFPPCRSHFPLYPHSLWVVHWLVITASRAV